jgi:hypothetical protein
LGPHVQILCRSFQLGAPCSNLPQIFPTWGPMFKSSADLSNLGLHLQSPSKRKAGPDVKSSVRGTLFDFPENYSAPAAIVPERHIG